MVMHRVSMPNPKVVAVPKVCPWIGELEKLGEPGHESGLLLGSCAFAHYM